MSIEDNDLSSLNDKRLLELTMRKREEVINKLTANNIVPEDKADKALLVSMLDGIDRTILAKSRIKADTKIADSNAQASSLIANILNSFNSKNIINVDKNREIPVLIHDDSTIEFIEGETDTGTQNNSFETFISKFPKQED
jgi:hypothetical protein